MAVDKTPVGLIGLGLIGTALSRRLLSADYPVLGYDVDEQKLETLRSLGGVAARSISEIAETCKRILIAVFDTDQVEAVLEGPAGILSAGIDSDAQKIVLVTSTCDPARIARLAERMEQRGLWFLETPLSGTSDQVARGEATCFVAGLSDGQAAVADILAAICLRSYNVGAVGNAGKTKLAINLILGINRAALAEGLVFAERIGLPLDAFLEIARGSAAYSQVMDVKGEKMTRGDFSAHGKVSQSLKDFSLILAAAAQHGQTLPFATVYADLMRACIAAGEADSDNSIIIRQIQRMVEQPAAHAMREGAKP
jgi:3-hydroxyisobutyrate dehydrogenase-like beta-hydroxyacid dehydrogenase